MAASREGPRVRNKEASPCRAKGNASDSCTGGASPTGRTFDDCKGVPHEIVLGRRQVMKALEETLSAMEPGEERILELSPAEAYGAYDESALQRVPTYRIPNGENLPWGR